MAIKLSDYDPALKAGAEIDVVVDLNDIKDGNGNELIEFDTVASAVNYVRIANAITGTAPQITAQGDDTNIGLILSPAGTGSVIVASTGATGTVLTVSGTQVTTGALFSIENANGLNTGSIAVFRSNSTSASTRSLMKIVNDNTSATGATALEIQQDAAATGLLFSGTPTTGLDLTLVGSTNFIMAVPATTTVPIATSATVVNTGWFKVSVAGTTRYLPFYT